MAKLQEHFRVHVQELLDVSGVSQSELARRMGVTPSLVNQYLTGHRSPGLDMVVKFADALEVTDPLDLLREEKLTAAS